MNTLPFSINTAGSSFQPLVSGSQGLNLTNDMIAHLDDFFVSSRYKSYKLMTIVHFLFFIALMFFLEESAVN